MTPLPHIRYLHAFLKRGGVIAYPTESCFGFGCDPRNARAVERILRLKGRPRVKGLILIGSDCHQFLAYLAPIADEITRRFSDWWPGPNTLLLQKGRHAPRWLTGRHEKMAVRVTAHPETARLCHWLDMPLVSTSANRAGRRAIMTANECRRQFGKKVLVLDGHIGHRKRPSTILDPVNGGVLRV